MGIRRSVVDVKGKRIYCVGICGTGMSSLAVHLASLGAQVEGSDNSAGYYTAEFLAEHSIPVHAGCSRHRLLNASPDLVLYSAAYDPNSHEELRAAQEHGVPCISYPDMLSVLSRHTSSICVAGSHGKTTTSVMVLRGLDALGVSAAALIGTSFRGGTPPYDVLVIEACEYRRHFLKYHPDIAVITSLDHDHVDCYPTMRECTEAFQAFAYRASSALVLGRTADVQHPQGITVIPCGLGGQQEYRAEPMSEKYTLHPWGLAGAFLVPGDHIAEDALAAMAAVTSWCRKQGRVLGNGEIQKLFDAVRSYPGARRRFESVGEASGVLVYDDYAHHPREIEAVISGIRDRWPHRRLVVDFVPHTFSRTAFFLDDFAQALSLADEVILQDIYPSQREQGHGAEADSGDIAALVPGSRWFRDYDSSFRYLAGSLKSGDFFITMGAGENRNLSFRVLDALRHREG